MLWTVQVLRQNEVLAKKFFEPWSYIQSEHSMTELTQALQPLQVLLVSSCDFLPSLSVFQSVLLLR
eukprot:COSAG05_NODE_48_length_24425_cov_90.438543_16_plen_66_part_00